MKILKKVLIALGIIVGIVVVLAVAFFFRYKQMANTINSVELYALDLSEFEDGVYQGEYGEFLVHVVVEVTVQDHKITKITIIDQRAGPGYEALATID
jgi:uncharacterized protein with FMN-binding domain